MDHFIISASHQYFTGDWEEESPKWNPSADAAYRFASKAEALDTMREHIATDRAAKRVPGFGGCRAASVISEAFRTLKKADHDVRIDGSDVVIVIEPKNVLQAKKELPRNLYGIKVGMRTTMGQVIR
jgi:hypothetical protein